MDESNGPGAQASGVNQGAMARRFIQRNIETEGKQMKNRFTKSSKVRDERPATERPELIVEQVPGQLPAATSSEYREREAASAEPAPNDAFHLYLREIGQIKLLTPKEEIVLAKRIKRGDKQAREQMIKANLRLVVKIARDYDGLGLPLLDLVNEGNIGLMKGVERFNPTKGAKLSTYASWWIKQSIKRALANQSKTIRLPVHVVDKLAHMRRTETKLREELDREPSEEEVAQEMGMSPRRVRQYRDASRAPVALDSPVGTEEGTTISEIVADSSAAAPFDQMVMDNDNEMVREAMSTLDARESKMLAMRFGLDDGKPKTLEEVGEHFGVTRERIRQIQELALRKLRKRIEQREQPSRPLSSVLSE
jgi:RNA polymerase primary sigma factor